MIFEAFSSNTRPPVKTRIHKWVDMFVEFLMSDLSPERSLPIYIGIDRPRKLEPHIFYNCEQLTRKGALETQIIPRSKHQDVVEVWDYSLANVEILKQYGITARYVPLKTPASVIQKLCEYRSSQKIKWDIGFCGCVDNSQHGNRRLDLLNQLKKAGLSVRIITSYGEQRDRELAQCRIMINIHYSPEFNIWETQRCQPWMDAGVTVISEHSLDDNPACINVPYDKLVEECVRQVALFNSSH
jgi:hypothetical protein